MTKIKFPNDFIWGTATSSYQIEGAWNEDDKGESVWDHYSHTPSKIQNSDTGDIACDHYHRFEEDVNIMREIGLKAYRFSISWPRIFPTGKGKVNRKGVEFYDNLINKLLENDIEPCITLYHWDLPLELSKVGGWESNIVVEAFENYAQNVFNLFGNRVKQWITFNEPLVFTLLFYPIGLYGKKDFSLAFKATHMVNLAHAKAIKAYRSCNYPDGKIGITLNLSHVYPMTESELDIKGAKVKDGFVNRWFLDPVLKGKYPEDILEIAQNEFRFSRPLSEDLNLLRDNPMDFLGINNYSCDRVHLRKEQDLNNIVKILLSERPPKGAEVSEMGWEVCPGGFYDLLKRVDKDYEHPEIHITENGTACKDDQIKDGIVHDEDRISYLKRYLKAAYDAISEGVKVRSYFLWSLMDNFEWVYGYSKKFGIIKIDFNTQERIWKKSALWYRNTIKNNRFSV